MGTRNLTAVMANGEYKIAQYGQWDGYPSGQGVTILDFLSDWVNIKNLKEALPRCRFIDFEGRDKEFLEAYDKNAPKWSNEPDNRTREQRRWFNTYMTRDLGGEILINVAESKDDEILLRNSIDFAGESLHCEWAYVIDLDKGALEIYKGFNTIPVPESERFANAPTNDMEFEDYNGGPKHKYYAVKHIKTYSLDALPTKEEFIAELETGEDE